VKDDELLEHSDILVGIS